MSDMLPRPEPRDEFKRALRANLMAQAPGVLAKRETSWTFWPGLLRPAMVAAAIALLVAAGAGSVAAGSLPGDAVFPLKVAAEQVQLAFALDDGTRLRLLAEQADHRLAELAEAVSARPKSAPAAEAAYANAVKTLTVAVEAVRSQPNVTDETKSAAENVVDSAHEKHEAVLDDLQRKLSPAEQPEIDRAKQETDKLQPSGRPDRTVGPAIAPEGNRTLQPSKTITPARTPEPTRSPRAEGSLPPGPADRR